MTKLRDIYRDIEYYRNLIKQREKLARESTSADYIEERKQYDPLAEACCPSSAARVSLGAVCAAYAAGFEHDALSKKYNVFAEVLIHSEKEFIRLGERDGPNDVNLISLRFVSRMMSFGAGLGCSDELLFELAKCIPTGYDQLIDTILARYQPDRPIHEELRYGSLHRPWIQLIDAPEDKRVGAAAKTLNRWETYLKRDRRWPSHDRPTFDGYWSYELAAIVCAFELDDSAFIEHQYYPGDLMKWRR